MIVDTPVGCVKPPRHCTRLRLCISAVLVDKGEVLGCCEASDINEGNNYILVETFNVSPIDTVFLLDFVSKTCGYSPALSG